MHTVTARNVAFLGVGVIIIRFRAKREQLQTFPERLPRKSRPEGGLDGQIQALALARFRPRLSGKSLMCAEFIRQLFPKHVLNG